MSLHLEQTAEAFCRHRFAVTYPCGEELMGRAAVIDRCDQSAKFLETVSTTITKLKMIRAENVVLLPAG